jgi:hypothetical protein
MIMNTCIKTEFLKRVSENLEKGEINENNQQLIETFIVNYIVNIQSEIPVEDNTNEDILESDATNLTTLSLMLFNIMK